MKALKYNILVLLMLFASQATLMAQVNVVAQVDNSKEIYVGERFTFNVIIDGDNKPALVDIKPLAKFDPKSAGNQDVSQTSIRIINGRTTKQILKRLVMAYSLVISQQGTHTIPSLTVTLDGKNYTTNPVTVNIQKPGTTDSLAVEVEISEKSCYIGQPVVLTVKIYISADIDNFNLNIPTRSFSSISCGAFVS